MAAKRKRRARGSGSTTATEVDRRTLPGAFVFALERLASLEGGYAALSRAIQIDAKELRAWAKRGPSRALVADEARFSQTLSVLYARLAWWDRTEQVRGRREEILELSRLPDTHRRMYAERLKADVEAINRVDRSMRRKLSGYETVARRLGGDVTASQVKSWIRRGMVARDSLAAVVRAESLRGVLSSKENRKTLRHLMSLARKPGTRLTGRRAPDGGPEVGPAERIAPFRGEGVSIDSDARSGYRWSRNVGKFLSDEVVAEMVEFARGVTLPREYRQASRRWNEWMVTAVLVEWSPPEAPPRKADKSDKNVVRQFGKDGPADGGGSESDRELGADMVINQGRSGAACRTREQAISTFQERMSNWLDEPLLCFVQGVIVAWWRNKSFEESTARMESRIERRGAIGRARSLERRRKRSTEKRPKKRAKKGLRARDVPRAIDVLEEGPPPSFGSKKRKKKAGKRPRKKG